MKNKASSLRQNLIGDKVFYSQVLAIVVPIIIQNTITNVVSLLDNVMVGRVGTLEMSAVAIDNQLLFVFALCIFGGMAGAGIFATQFAGANDNTGVRHCFRVKLMVGFVMLAAAFTLFLALPDKLISLYLAEDTDPADAAATLQFGLDYLRIMLVGLVPFTISQAYASTLREVGETRLPMISSVIAIVVNLVFNYLLIFGTFGFPRLGVSGAAIATVLSRFVEAVIIIVFTHRHSRRFPFIKGSYSSIKVPAALMRDIMKRGMPLLVNEFLWSAGMATLSQCYSVRGLEVVAAVNISTTVANLFNVVFLSMGNAVAIMVGQNLGANEIEKAKQTAWRIITATVAASVVMGGIMAVCAPFIPQIYNTEDSVREMAKQLLLIGAFMMPVLSFTHDCYFTMRSGGKTGIVFAFDSGFTWGIVVPFAFVLANFTSVPIIPLYFAVQSMEIIKGIVGFILVKKGVWVRNIINE